MIIPFGVFAGAVWAVCAYRTYRAGFFGAALCYGLGCLVLAVCAVWEVGR